MGSILQKQEKNHTHPRLISSKPHKYDNEEYIKAKIDFLTKEEFQIWEKKFDSEPGNHNFSFRPQPQNSDSSKIINLNGTFSNLKCGSMYRAEVLYPAHWIVMQDQLQKIRRIEMGDPDKEISEERIWKLLNNLIQLAAVYHSNGQKVGDIQPKNILISGNGELKIFTKDSWPNQTTNYTKTVIDKVITYLSPEQQHEAIIGFSEQSVPEEEGQAFSIGLTCLDALLASLSMNNSAKEIYQIKEELNQRLLAEKVEIVMNTKKYTPSLLAAILCLIEIDPQKRIKPEELCSWLKNQSIEEGQFPKIGLDCPEKLMNKYAEIISILQIQPEGDQMMKLQTPNYRNYEKIEYQQIEADSEPSQVNMIQQDRIILNGREIQQTQKQDRQEFLEGLHSVEVLSEKQDMNKIEQSQQILYSIKDGEPPKEEVYEQIEMKNILQEKRQPIYNTTSAIKPPSSRRRKVASGFLVSFD